MLDETKIQLVEHDVKNRRRQGDKSATGKKIRGKALCSKHKKRGNVGAIFHKTGGVERISRRRTLRIVTTGRRVQ